MVCSSDGILALLLLGVGLLAATVHLQSKGHQVRASITTSIGVKKVLKCR